MSALRSRSGGMLQVDDVEAEEEVLAEAASLDHVGEVAVGSGEDAGGDGDGLGGADGAHFFFLQGAEQLGLEVEGKLADLVEEDGAAGGGGEQAGLGAVGTGEGALDVAEELAFDEGGDERAAIDGDEGLGSVGAVVVDGAGDELLAGAGLAEDEDGVGGEGDLGEDAVELLHGGRAADEVTHADAGAEAFAEQAGLVVEGAAVGGAFEGGGEVFEGEGLGEIVARAGAHGFDGGADGGEGGHDDDDCLWVVGVDLVEQGEAAAAGELEVEEDEVDLAVGEDVARGGEGVGGLGKEAEGGGDLSAGRTGLSYRRPRREGGGGGGAVVEASWQDLIGAGLAG